MIAKPMMPDFGYVPEPPPKPPHNVETPPDTSGDTIEVEQSGSVGGVEDTLDSMMDEEVAQLEETPPDEPLKGVFWPENDYIGSGEKSDQDKSSGGVTWNIKKEIEDINIMGLPPIAYTKDGGEEGEKLRKLIVASMPIVELTPCLASFGSANEQGLNLFHLDPQKGETKYKDILKVAGFQLKESDLKLPIQIAFLNEGAIGESWSSTYGDTGFENKLNSLGNNNIAEMRQMTGASNIGDFLKDMESQGERDNPMGTLFALGGSLGAAAVGLGGAVLGGILGDTYANAAMKLFSGSKVDFPVLWQGSSFDPSYSISVRLYNPTPSSMEAYEKFILLPLAKLLAFCVPLTDSPYVYDFPLMCKAKCAGLFKLPAAVVSSISVIKGGNTNDVTYQQQPSIVEVQLTLQSLYSTMVAMTTEESEEQTDEERPTFKKYFDSLRDWYDYKNFRVSESEGEGEEEGVVGEETPDADTALDGEMDMDSLEPRISDDLGSFGDDLGGLVDAPLSGIESITGSVGDSLSGITDSLDGALGGITGSLDGITGGITGALGDVTGGISGVMDSAMGGLDGMMGGLDGFTSSIGGFVGGSMDGIMGSVTGGLGNITGGLDNVMGGLDNALTSNIESITAPLDSLKNIDGMFSEKFSNIKNDIIGTSGIDVLSNDVNGILDQFQGTTGIPDMLGDELSFSFGNMSMAPIDTLSTFQDRLETSINCIDLPNGTNFPLEISGRLSETMNIFDTECLSINNLDTQFNIFEDFEGMKPLPLLNYSNEILTDAIDITTLGVTHNPEDTSLFRISNIKNELQIILDQVQTSIQDLNNLDFSSAIPVRVERRELERDMRDYVQLPESEKPLVKPNIEDKVINLMNLINSFKNEINVAIQTINQTRNDIRNETTSRVSNIGIDIDMIRSNNIETVTGIIDLDGKVDDMREHMSEMLYSSFS